MVNIIDEWEIIEEYAGDNLGFYQLLEADGCFEIRVQTGRLGFKKEFEGQDPELLSILSFCRRHRYIKVCKTTSDADFFK